MFPFQSVQVFGEQGRIEIEIPFNAPPDKPTRITYQSNDEIKEIKFDVCNQYTIQGELFSKSIIEDLAVPTPIADALANMHVIEAVKLSNKKGTWV